MLVIVEEWVNGEVTQGKIMLAIGALVLVACLFIFRSHNDLLRGALIPLTLVTVVLLGYGGFQVFGRPAHVDRFEKAYAEDPAAAIEQEKAKALQDDRNYSLLKKVWPVLIALTALSWFFVTTEYYRGLIIGGVLLFLTTLFVDTILHERLLVYLEKLLNSTNQ